LTFPIYIATINYMTNKEKMAKLEGAYEHLGTEASVESVRTE